MLTVTKKSWHFKMAHRGGHRYYSEMTSLCDYAVNVLKGMAKYSVVVVALAYIVIGITMNVAFYLQFGEVHRPEVGSGFMGLWFTIGVGAIVVAISLPAAILILMGLFHLTAKVGSTIGAVKNTTLIRAVHDGIKEKYCPTVAIRD